MEQRPTGASYADLLYGNEYLILWPLINAYKSSSFGIVLLWAASFFMCYQDNYTGPVKSTNKWRHKLDVVSQIKITSCMMSTLNT